MDTVEVAAAFGATVSGVQVALSRPNVNPALARKLPTPLRKIGKSWVWRRADVEMAVALAAAAEADEPDPCNPQGITRPKSAARVAIDRKRGVTP
jgi:hypothetical protein